MEFRSFLTYTYNENPFIRHGSAGLFTLVLVFDFFGGFFSGILGWKWAFLVIFVWAFFYHRKFLGEAIHVKTYDEIIRDIASVLIGLIFVLVFGVGYFAGPDNRWWLCLPLIFVHVWISKVILKPWTRGKHH